VGGDGGCSVPVALEAVVPDVQPAAASDTATSTGTSDTGAKPIVVTVRPPRRIRLSSAGQSSLARRGRALSGS
jgi:hypothetical protein